MKKNSKGKVFNCPSNWPLGGQFQPIHEIPELDLLDGTLMGAGSFKPLRCTKFNSLLGLDP
jgi:hypothetical protein